MKNSLFIFNVLSLAVLSGSEKRPVQRLRPPCDSEIYCHGSLLETVQLAGIFNDSKTFVDMPMINSPQVTLENFNKLLRQTYNNPNQAQIRTFLEANFLATGSEFVPWDPVDFNPKPKFLELVKDPELSKFGKHLVQIWKQLGRQTSDEVFRNPDKHSLIPLPNPVIVPGGRFQEIYYWDSYWTIEGLLLSEMKQTAKGMLENFVELIKQFGFIPNGGRVYYRRRSQPPYFISMVKAYLDSTGDLEFVRKNINYLEKEFLSWEEHRSTEVKDPKSGKTYKVNQYNVQVDGPRPESFKEDYTVASTLPTEGEKQQLYVNLKSAAESGNDFSTRWFVTGDTNEGDLIDVKTTSIIPVDLNSLMCRNARLLSEFYKQLGHAQKAEEYKTIAYAKKRTIADLFWDEVDGVWHDLNRDDLEKRRFFYVSNFHPLWSGCYGLEGRKKNTVKSVISYLEKSKALEYVGGVPTSLYNSGQQWDFPNAWAPLQHILTFGLYNARSLNPYAENLAFEIAQEFIRTIHTGFLETDGAIFEKYNVTEVGVAGEGGEYNVQIGFGWTNGVAMTFMNTFGDRLSVKPPGGRTPGGRTPGGRTPGGQTSIKAGKLLYPKY